MIMAPPTETRDQEGLEARFLRSHISVSIIYKYPGNE